MCCGMDLFGLILFGFAQLLPRFCFFEFSLIILYVFSRSHSLPPLLLMSQIFCFDPTGPGPWDSVHYFFLNKSFLFYSGSNFQFMNSFLYPFQSAVELIHWVFYPSYYTFFYNFLKIVKLPVGSFLYLLFNFQGLLIFLFHLFIIAQWSFLSWLL